VACCTFFSSCNKKARDEDETKPMGTIKFHLHSFIEDEEIDLYNIPYTTHAGRSISVSIAQLYISEVELVRLDGSVYSIPNSKVLKKLDSDTYFIGEAPAGNYQTVRFKVGLPPTSNVVDYSDTKDSAMWFSKTKADDGYIFLNVQGAVDTSEAFTGTLTPFAYKIGSNVNYKQVTMPNKGYTVVGGEVYYIHLMADFSRLFSGIKINEPANLSVKTVVDNTSAVAQKVMNNIPSLFIYE